MIKYLKSRIKSNQFLISIIFATFDLFKSKKRYWQDSPELDSFWEERVNKVCSHSDNEKISRVTDAGLIRGNKQIMHNGLTIRLGSYYGVGAAAYGTHEMLRRNKGVHEPEEEALFSEILKKIKPNSVMLELGSYWAFYSMWFNQEIRSAKNYMIEPDARCLYCGKCNFKDNGLNGDFTQAYIGAESGKIDGIEVVGIDQFLKAKKINHLSVLHSDIQGYEFEMLKGARSTFLNKKVDYVFISTHSNELHYACLDLIKEYGYNVIASIDLDTTSSYDGLIVCQK